MPVLSMMTIEGSADELIAGMRQMREATERKAREYGGISSTVCRTDDGIMVVNIWETEEGRHQMAADPEVQEALRSAGFPRPDFKAYEVLEHMTAS